MLENEIDMLHMDLSRTRKESKEDEKKQHRRETFWEEQVFKQSFALMYAIR